MAATQRFTPFVRQIFVSAAVCINVVGYGCMVGYPAVLLPQLRDSSSIININKAQESWITSLMGFAMLAGNFVTPTIMDRLGRKMTHHIVSIAGLAAWFLNTTAVNFEMLFVSRIIHGIGMGILLSVRSALIGECSSPKYRGSFLTLISLAQCFGIFFAHLIGTLLHWQTTALICTFFPFISFVMTMFFPETPSYLAAKGRYEKCAKSFHWLRGYDEEKELEELILAREAFNKVESKMNFRELLLTMKKKEFYKPIIIMIHANILMQYCGGATMAAYSTVIIGLIMGPSANVHFWMVFLDAQRVVLNAMTVYVMDKLKRRTMLLYIGSLSVIVHLSIAGYVYARNNGFVGDYQWIPILLINLHISTVAIGMVPIPTVISGEVFPLQYRSIGGSIGIVAGSVFTFIVLKTFPFLVDGVGIHGTYGIYGGIIAYILTVMLLFLPETKGKTLQEIEDELRGRPLTVEEAEEEVTLQRKIRKVSVWSTHSLAVDT